MGRISALVGVLLLLAMAMAVAVPEPQNASSPGSLFWSTAKEEKDLLQKSNDSNHDSTSYTPTSAAVDDLDGGFSSLNSMLQWAIGCHLYTSFQKFVSMFLLSIWFGLVVTNSSGHFDPAKLKETAEGVQRLSR
ncbi:hypothetical protein SLEP1_g25977 [Rubroshorea leprosula]|uniref:Uncharacterized protein n=1 Tax=Rubroshorea leprosula TaxID=152421 RepID=A0AAV5JY29_9ROSI|nr:hypothetical protein SLEP1_g25977 [Rubroshorea leprosula]